MNVRDFKLGYGTVVCNSCGTDHEQVKEVSEGNMRNPDNVKYLCEECYSQIQE